MPRYTYLCNACEKMDEKFLSISEFLKTKGNIIKCENCESGNLIHKINSVTTKVEKSNDQIVLDIEEEVQKTVNKINNGDQRLIEDVYGDRANPYKR